MAKWDPVAGWRDNFFNMDGGEYCKVMALIGYQVSAELAKIDPNFPTSCPISKVGGRTFTAVISQTVLSYKKFLFNS